MQTLKIAPLVLAGAVLTVACGDSNSSLNPTAPSAVSAAVQQDPDAATGGESGPTGGPKGNNGNGNGNGNNGNGNGNGNGRGGNDQPTVPSAPTPPGNVTPPSNTTPSNTTPTGPIVGRVEIEGLITAVGDNTITIGTRTVFVPEDVVIRHGNRFYELDDLREGDRVHIKANRVAVQGSSPTAAAPGEALVATEVKLQNPGDDADDDDDDDDDDGGTSGTTRVRPKGGS